MALIISHPFRLSVDGRVATVEQDSERGDAEQLAVLALTRQGERPLVPAFGLPDPTFAGFEASELAAAVSLWGPDVALGDIVIEAVDDHTERVQVGYR